MHLRLHAVLTHHVGLMAIAQTLTGFFAVWTVHHDCDREHHIARTLRNPLKSAIALDMFFHLEHHLFPEVPSYNLKRVHQLVWHRMPRAVGGRSYLGFVARFVRASARMDDRPIGLTTPAASAGGMRVAE